MNISSNKLSALRLSALLVGVAVSAWAQTYVATDLGTLSGDFYTFAAAINNSGQVVGWASGAAPHAFLYSGGTMTDLGTFPGGYNSSANSINDSGVVVGSANIPPLSSGIVHAFLYSGGTMTDLGTLPGGGNSFALGINDSGVVVGYIDTGVLEYEAFLYSNGTMGGLGTLPGYPDASASGINNSGVVVGCAQIPGGAYLAFLYSGGTMTDLGTLPGGSLSCANSVNDAGWVVGHADASGSEHAFLYSGGTMTDLGTLPGDYGSAALGINNAGWVVGFSISTANVYRAFLYSGGTMLDLNNLVSLPSNVLLGQAVGINNLGQIAAQGSDGHSYLLTPIVTYTIAGQVTLSGSGLSGVTMTLSGSHSNSAATNGSGNYSFTVAAAGNYTVTPSLVGYTFTPPSQSFSNTSGNQTADFTSQPQSGITSPAPGIALSDSLADFSWNPVSGATEYQLSVGTTPGGTNIFNGTTTGTSQTVDFIPCTGGTIYVELSAYVNGSFQPAGETSYPCKSAIGDFNGDRFQDLLWQNNSTGQVNVNYYGGAGPQPQGSGVLNNGVDLTGWLLVGAADFDGNGTPDLVYQNTQTGQVNVNYYAGTNFAGWACLSCGIDTTNWRVVAVADFDGNGTPDLVYQNTQTHQVNVDYYGGTGGATFIGWACLSCGIDTTTWQVVAAADFDGKGTPDLVYQNTQTHQVNVDYYGGAGGATFMGWACLSCGIDTTDWQVVGAVDMNADGVPDLIYQNTQTGQVNVDYYGGAGGASFKGWNCLNCGSIVAGLSVRAVAKFGGSGEPDLVYQNTTTNAVTVYYYGLGGAIPQGSACVSCGINTTDWQLVGTGDFDGNGTPDLVYQNTQTHQVNVDYYSGTTFVGWACLSCGIDTTNWQVVAVADFDGNGTPDLVYQNTQTHQVNVDYYGGTGGASFIGWACLSCGIDTTDWQVKAAADLDGNGIPDLIYQNTQTGQVNVDYYGGHGGAAFIGWAYLNSNPGAGWSPVSAK